MRVEDADHGPTIGLGRPVDSKMLARVDFVDPGRSRQVHRGVHGSDCARSRVPGEEPAAFLRISTQAVRNHLVEVRAR